MRPSGRRPFLGASEHYSLDDDSLEVCPPKQALAGGGAEEIAGPCGTQAHYA